MRYIGQHIQIIIKTFDGSLPLAHFLKNYFRQHPILGSRDRKMLSAMAYSWYRCSKGISSFGFAENNTYAIGIEERVGFCVKMCNNEKMLPTGWPSDHEKELSFDLTGLFPYEIALSDGIANTDWLRSMLVQPDLFIRVRKDMSKVTALLNTAQIPFTAIDSNCLALPNGAKIDALLPPASYAVQDASSQRTGTFFAPKKGELWYDCCSGAGGKSLLLKDMEPGVRITISDVRESIVHNLKERFKLYGMELPEPIVTDISDPANLQRSLSSRQFDNIICDAPCSGSGTWARTPEQLYFFDPVSIDKFAALQKKIATNVAAYLKKGGKLIYITCSVFKQENENVVNEIMAATGLQLVHSELVNGTAIKADSMFVAVLEKV